MSEEIHILPKESVCNIIKLSRKHSIKYNQKFNTKHMSFTYTVKLDENIHFSICSQVGYDETSGKLGIKSRLYIAGVYISTGTSKRRNCNDLETTKRISAAYYKPYNPSRREYHRQYMKKWRKFSSN